MNEEELINKIWRANSNKIRLLLTRNTIQKEEYLSDLIRYGVKEGFQEGKLEQKKEELEWLKTINELSFICPECESSFVLKNFRLVNRIKQLQKEIGDDSQQPRMKQTRGGELKSDEGLHSTDNGSPADIVSKEDSENNRNKLIKFGRQEAIKRFEKMIEEIWTINGTGCFYLKGINNNEVRRVERLKKFASQLKQEKEKEIGGMK